MQPSMIRPLPGIYALSMFLLASLTVTTAYVAHLHEVDRQQEGLAAQLSPIWLDGLITQAEEIQYLLHEKQAYVDENLNTPLGVVIPPMKGLAELSQELLNYASGNQANSSTIQQLFITCERAATYHHDNLVEHGKSYGLRATDVEEILVRAETARDAVDQRLIDRHPIHNQLDAVAATQLTIGYLAYLMADLYRYASRRSCWSLEEYFPVVIPTTNHYFAGQTNTVKLAVGSYLVANHLDFKIVVGSDTLNPGADGTVIYELPTKSRGPHQLLTEVLLTNKLTGLVVRGGGRYTYEVR